MSDANTEQCANDSVHTLRISVAQDDRTPYNVPKRKLKWNAKRVAAIDREWPVLILTLAALTWAVMNVLVLGFTAAEIVFLKVLGLTMACAGAIWLGVNLWDYLHREKA